MCPSGVLRLSGAEGVGADWPLATEGNPGLAAFATDYRGRRTGEWARVCRLYDAVGEQYLEGGTDLDKKNTPDDQDDTEDHHPRKGLIEEDLAQNSSEGDTSC